jgi:carbamate kinase
MLECGFGPMAVRAGFANLLSMRILIALDDGDIANAVESLAEIAGEHEVVIACPDGATLGLGLGDTLPDRDVVTVLSQVVVSADDAAFAALAGDLSPDPIAIVELRSVRGLIAAGSLVICAPEMEAPVIVGKDGTMRGVEAALDGDLVGALLARRLDVDLFLLLGDGAPGSTPAKEEAARRFIEATGRRAAIGELKKAVEIVRDASGAQTFARHA